MKATIIGRLKQIATSKELSTIESAVINTFIKHPEADGFTTSTLRNLTGILFLSVITNKKFKDLLAQHTLKVQAHRVKDTWVYTLVDIKEETEPRE